VEGNTRGSSRSPDTGDARTLLHRPDAQGQRGVGTIAIYRQEGCRLFTDKQIELLRPISPPQAVIASRTRGC